MRIGICFLKKKEKYNKSGKGREELKNILDAAASPAEKGQDLLFKVFVN